MGKSKGKTFKQGYKARETVFLVLMDYERRDAYLNSLLVSRLEDPDLDRKDRALVTELVQGTVRRKLTLDWVLSQLSNRPLEELDISVLWVMRMSVYQILFTSVSEYAAVDLGVEITRNNIGETPVSFVNAILRKLSRQKGTISYPDPILEPIKYLEITHSHPRWLIEMWSAELGLERTENLCIADNMQPMLSVRVNEMKASTGEVAAALTERGIEVVSSPLAPEGLLLRGSGAVTRLEEYRDGKISVQDHGSMTVGRMLSPEPGMSVLDLCAGAGGKANHLAELMKNKGRILATDINPDKLNMAAEAAERLGNSIVETRVLDGIRVSKYVDERFDRVLVDAPCSGLGILARRPDARWRKSESSIEGLVPFQLLILNEAAKMVKDGGLLLYSTCTISRRENREVCDSFVEENTEFSYLPSGREEDDRYVQLYPDKDGCDGTFIGLFRKGTSQPNLDVSIRNIPE
ncbi:MAG: 16S rRNA (cytosine(967)-C(5))-methyltransferase RsmB [Actinobacteria bacterium]|nr:16S rRNA (cytosine(967)-C(5))-methyltransferase RsmB [Actinomycetota bacterium]